MSDESKFETTPSVDDVTEWLTEAVAMKTATRVELFRAFGDRATDDRITCWENLSANDTGTIAKVAASMVKSAERSGRSVEQGEKVRYMFIARKADGSTADQLGVMVASGAPRRVDGTAAAAVEVRDAFQALSHAMTENTKLLALVVKAFDGRDESLVQQNTLLAQRCAHLEQEHSRTLNAQQKFVLFSMEQRQLTAKIARDEQRDQMIFDKLSSWAPLIMNRLLGGGPGKGAPGLDLMMSKLVESLTSSEVEALMDLPLPPDKKMVLGEIVHSFMQRDAARAAAKEAQSAAAHGIHNETLNGEPPS